LAQARGVCLTLDPSIAELESSLLRPLLGTASIQPDKSGGMTLAGGYERRRVSGTPLVSLGFLDLN